MKFDEQYGQSVAETADGLRLQRCQLRASEIPQKLSNASDRFLLVLPLRHGRLRMTNKHGHAFEGAVQPGTIRFVQPGEWSSMVVQDSFDRVILSIPGPRFRTQVERAGMQVKGVTCPDLAPVFQSNFVVQRLAPIFETSEKLSVARRQLLVQGLAGTLMALLLDAELHGSEQSTAAFDREQFEHALEFAQLRLSQHLDLAEWAGALGLPTNEFARRFQKQTGVAPYTWIMDRRIELAKRLLAQGELALAEIALEAGFCSQSHFTEAFRRRVGTSPGRWRKSRAEASV